jgi:Rrf2 family protein
VLAQRYPTGAVKIRDIAGEEQLPEKFLEAILLDLQRARIVVSLRGANGGYQLKRPPKDISLSEVIRRIDGALVYGVILSNARGLREFGAVSVVSGPIRGLIYTMPLNIELLYNDYQFVPAFAVASLLALLALLTLVVKSVVEWKSAQQLANGEISAGRNP